MLPIARHVESVRTCPTHAARRSPRSTIRTWVEAARMLANDCLSRHEQQADQLRADRSCECSVASLVRPSWPCCKPCGSVKWNITSRSVKRGGFARAGQSVNRRAVAEVEIENRVDELLNVGTMPNNPDLDRVRAGRIDQYLPGHLQPGRSPNPRVRRPDGFIPSVRRVFKLDTTHPHTQTPTGLPRR